MDGQMLISDGIRDGIPITRAMKYFTAADDQLMDVRHEVIRRDAVTGIDYERRLVGGDLLNRDPGPGGLEREDPAGGHPPNERGPSGHRDHRLKVLELVLQRVRLGVAAVAAAAPVVVQHRKAGREQLRELDKAL